MDCQTDRHVTMYEAFRRAVGDKATVSYAKEVTCIIVSI